LVGYEGNGTPAFAGAAWITATNAVAAIALIIVANFIFDSPILVYCLSFDSAPCHGWECDRQSLPLASRFYGRSLFYLRLLLLFYLLYFLLFWQF
jgi:hypothetical protein